MDRKLVGTWLGAALLLIIVLACNPLSSASTQTGVPQVGNVQTLAAQTENAGGNNLPATAPTPEPTVSASGKLGEKISAQSVAITATQVEKSDGTSDVKPESGKTFLIVHLDVENLDDSTGLEVDEGDFQLRNAAGDTQDPFSDTVTSDQIQDLDLGPSEKASGTIVFEIPADDKGLHLLYDFNERHIDIDLGQ